MNNEKEVNSNEETSEKLTEEATEEATEAAKEKNQETSEEGRNDLGENPVKKEALEERQSPAKEPAEETADETEAGTVDESPDEPAGESFEMIDAEEEQAEEQAEEQDEAFDIDLVGEARERVNPVIPAPEVQPQTPNPALKTSSKSISGSKLFVMLVAAVLVGSLLSFSVFYAALPSLLQARGLADTGNNGESVVINPSSDLNVYSAVAEKAMPSVVGITTVQVTEGFFSGTQRSQGLGTGVIVDERGYILTNSHVINDGQADEVTVLLHDGSHHTAQVLWFEQSMDLAVIKIDGGINLIPAELGDSDALIVGEIVVAIGNPLGLNFERTLTQGVVSGLNRSIQVSATQIIDSLIQTDASINPGNSGGPLLNTQGQVIGINTAKMSSGEGLGFSIPINTAKPIVDQFIERGEFRRVYLGIRGFNAQNVESATGIRLEVEKGVFVVEVVPGSAADEANLQAEDIVIALGDVEVDTMGSLIRELYKFRPGDETTVTYLRGEEEITVGITLTE